MKADNAAPELLWWSGTEPYDYEPDETALDSAVTLTDLADLYGTDKGSLSGNYYTRVYERVIKPEKTKALCELGVACGASLKMWSHYLPHARVVGVDVRGECARVCRAHSSIEIVIGDVLSLDFPNAFEVVIDDASHIAEDIAAFFAHCWNWVSPGGLYVVEDLACTYMEDYAESVNVRCGTKKVNDRLAFLGMLDRIMRDLDHGRRIASFEYHPNLLVLQKMGA